MRRIIIHAIGAIVTGILAHFTHPLISVIADRNTRALTTYAVGVTCAVPAVIAASVELGSTERERRRFFFAYFIGFLAFGSGVALGRLIDVMRGGNWEHGD